MTDALEERVVNGYTIKIFYDDSCDSPHEDDCHFKFLGFPHRRYEIGDETIDPDRMKLSCQACSGQGYVITDDGVNDLECETCDGTGMRPVEVVDDLVEWVKREHDAIVVAPVGMIDHSGVAYYLGGGAHPHDPGGWDSGTCGVMIYTKAMQKEWGCEHLTEEEILEQMRADLTEYSDWANGNCQSYVIYDCQGEEVDSCWGFIGSNDKGVYYAMEAAVEYAESLDPALPKPVCTHCNGSGYEPSGA